jgi:peptidoglycan/LPS O-acetylase OafA/YrhL
MYPESPGLTAEDHSPTSLGLPVKKVRWNFLDSIRGLAALVVMINHAALVMPAPYSAALLPFYAGRGSAIMFFVLSGLVIAKSRMSEARSSYSQFLVRRFFRIFPPLAAALCFSILLYFLISPSGLPGHTRWFNSIWADGVRPRLVAGHLFLVGRAQDQSLDNVIWSLGYEIRISIWIPLMLIAARKFGIPKFVCLALLAAVVVEVLLRHRGIRPSSHYGATGLLDEVLMTGHFVLLFVAGLLIAMRAELVTRFFERLANWTKACLLALGFYLLCFKSDLYNGLGAILIIALAFGSDRLRAFLNIASLQWLGRISYSLYLVHLPILAAFQYLLVNVHPVLTVALALCTTFVAAHLLNQLVEVPSIAFGRRFIKGRAPSFLNPILMRG